MRAEEARFGSPGDKETKAPRRKGIRPGKARPGITYQQRKKPIHLGWISPHSTGRVGGGAALRRGGCSGSAEDPAEEMAVVAASAWSECQAAEWEIPLSQSRSRLGSSPLPLLGVRALAPPPLRVARRRLWVSCGFCRFELAAGLVQRLLLLFFLGKLAPDIIYTYCDFHIRKLITATQIMIIFRLLQHN